MSQRRPSFWDSPYFVPELDNWHLTEDAPEDIRKEFEEYMGHDCSEMAHDCSEMAKEDLRKYVRIPYCLRCKNVEKGMSCVAYPEGIPKEVLHTEKKDGEICNNGVGFIKAR